MAITRIKNSSINNKTPKYNDVLAGLPFRPIIGTASDGGNGTSASVAFTGNNVANGTITYTALSSPGSFTGTGTASPITVSGLTAGTAYTFQVKAGNSLGDSAYSAASNSVTPVTPTSYESIATVTVGSGGAGSITFSSIPSTFTHLELRSLVLQSTSGANMNLQFNGDTTGANYTIHSLYGDGSSVAAFAITSRGSLQISYWGGTTSYGTPSICSILDYANTNKYKTTRTLYGNDNNGSGFIAQPSGLWLSTSAITSMTITPSSGTINQYSHFALYGIKSA
jgi:hypothetical protein